MLCFILPNGQEKSKLKSSLFISYDGVRCFCCVVLFYHMVTRNLSLRNRFLYDMMASDLFVLLFCFTIMLICTVTFSFILIVKYTPIPLRNSLVRLLTFRQFTPGTQSATSTSTSSNYWPISTVWRLCQWNCEKDNKLISIKKYVWKYTQHGSKFKIR